MTDHAANAEEILKTYDRESNTAHYTGWPKKIIAAIQQARAAQGLPLLMQ